jgi:hypothetical protein
MIVGMATLIVQPVSQAREQLSVALARFRKLGRRAEPVVFGAHRKPEAVLLPYETYQEYERLAEAAARRAAVDSASGSVRAEGLEVSSGAQDIMARWVAGVITADEMIDATVRLHART